MRSLAALLLLVGPVALLPACSANSGGSAFGDGGAGGKAPETSNEGGGDDDNLGLGTGVGGGLPACDSGDDEDRDQDGVTRLQGDCNDCDANVNPRAVEVIADEETEKEPADEDCDGNIDNPPEPCDDALAVDDMDPLAGARAVELCKEAKDPMDWGVVSAQWVMVDGSPAASYPSFHLGHGLLGGFGPNVNVQQGGRMLALSSGTARQPSDLGYADVGGFDKGFTCAHPDGFPKESPACPDTITGEPHDGAALEVTLRAPSNAKGFSFDFNFYTYEWPSYVCSTFNDFFIALLSPIPVGQADGNISFDSQGNPVSVNNAFLEVCGCDFGPPCSAGGKDFTCSLGNNELMGTGFGPDTGFADHGATSWLVTTAPVEPGSEITIRWGVYDSGDGILDSTTLIDNWQWSAEPGSLGTVPIPDPR